MQFLTDTKIDFMKYRKVFVWVSLALLAVASSELAIDGLNLGIDFAGGTQTAVRLREAPEVETLRGQLASSGLEGVAIQQFGEEQDREILIKVPVVPGSEEGRSDEIFDALDGIVSVGVQGFDLNRNGSDALATFLYAADPQSLLTDTDNLDPEGAARREYNAIADRVIDARNQVKILDTWDQVAAVDGVDESTMAVLQADAYLGGFSILSTESVGPQIGGELQQKGLLAIIFSLLGMLAYIWIRFELRFGIGALVAVFHDFLIVLGLYALLDLEFNLSTIAAFLTLVGYSVNDTVVIFDRVRENMRRFRRVPLVEIMNTSINQTLSRTLMTSGTTMMAVTCLYLIAGGVIQDFAFVLLIGVVIGTYSSVFVASPFALLWEKWFGHDARKARADQPKVNTA